MKIITFTLAAAVSLFLQTGLASSQSITEAWLRQASISCGGGLSAEVEGEISGALVRSLKIIGGEGEGAFRAQDLNRLLQQFQSDEKVSATNNYYTCLLTLMQLATDASGLPPKSVVLESPVSISPLEVIKRGQRVAMKPGDSIAIGDASVIFSVIKLDNNRTYGPYFYFRWSNSAAQTQADGNAYQAGVLNFGDQCSMVPYKIDLEGKLVSLLVNC